MPKKNPITEVRELYWYAHALPEIKKLAKTAAAQTVGDAAARAYGEDNLSPGQWRQVFTAEDRRVVGERLRDDALTPADNPLMRVKIKSPPQRPKGTTAKPSARLVKRRKVTAKAPRGLYANPRKPRPYVSAEVMNDGGFAFGLDEVTDVSIEFTTVPRARKGSYISWKLPASVIANPEFQAWAQHVGGSVVMSVRALKKKIKSFM